MSSLEILVKSPNRAGGGLCTICNSLRICWTGMNLYEKTHPRLTTPEPPTDSAVSFAPMSYTCSHRTSGPREDAKPRPDMTTAAGNDRANHSQESFLRSFCDRGSLNRTTRRESLGLAATFHVPPAPYAPYTRKAGFHKFPDWIVTSQED